MDLGMRSNPEAADINAIVEEQWDFLLKCVNGNEKLLPKRHPRWTFDVLGCGTFGCVYRTETPGVVLKITANASEIRLWRYVFEHPQRGVIQVFDYAETEIPGDEDLGIINNYYAIWRSEVRHLSHQEDFPGKLYDSLEGISYATAGAHALMSFEEYDDLTDPDERLYLIPRDPRRVDLVTMHLHKYMTYLKKLEEFPIGQAFATYFSDGWLLGDMHINNVGFDETNTAVLFDAYGVRVDSAIISKVVEEAPEELLTPTIKELFYLD